MVVHHVKVNPVCASVNDVFDLFAQAGKVGRQNGGGDAKGGACAVHGGDYFIPAKAP
jgi:hypothetical protein